MEELQRRTARNSGVELIKVIAIILIVCSHVVQTLGSINNSIPFQDYVVDLSIATNDISQIILAMLRYSGALGNTLFFVCSAWFLLESKRVSIEKEMSMILDIWIISVIILAVVFAMRNGDLSTKDLLKSFFPTIFANNWYLTCYLLFYPIHTSLNEIIYSMSQKALLKAAVWLSVLYIGFNFISGFFFSSSLILWVAIYFVVAYIKLYLPTLANNKKVNAIALVIGVLGNCGIILITNFLGMNISFFEDKLQHWNNNCSPFFILIAISALNLARQMDFVSKPINYISKLSFLIYIIHENLLFRTYYRPLMWHYIYSSYGYEHIIIWVLAMVLIVFLFGFISSVVYVISIKRFSKLLSHKITTIAEKVYSRIEKEMLKVS